MCIGVPGGPRNPHQQQINNFEAVLKHLMHRGGEMLLPNRLEGTSQYKNVFVGKLDEDLPIVYDAPMGGAYVRDKHAVSPLTTLANLRFMDFRVGRCVLGDPHSHTSGCYGPMEALSWWSECYLKNVDRIYVGCGYPEGIVDCLNEVTPNKLIQQNLDVWSPSICHMFLEQTLREMLDVIGGTDDPYLTFEFNYVAEKRKIYVRTEAGSRRCPLLPECYIQMMENE
ncbi:hypothetical protein KR074_006306 [Drosophila pseudoananassae]|nr:hypothetical protein KR074_006306 [Drosophila pseudoananassae]